MPIPTDGEEIGPEVLDEPPSSRPGLSDKRLFHIALALALLPLLVSAVALVVDVGNRYQPTSDLALTEMQVRDIGHHEVLNGLYSRADWRHPGPMLFYLLAPLYWLTGHASIALNLGALIINAAAIAGMAVIARRRGGTPLMLCTLLGCGLLVRTLGGDFMHDFWNNYITVLPFGLMIFLAWDLTCGDIWALPVATVVASFLFQTHVGFLALAVPLLVWGVVWMAVPAWRSTDARKRELVRSGLLSAAVLVVLWLPTLIDVALHAPSNAERIVRWFGRAEEGTHTVVQGWRVIRSQFALRPEWMTYHRPFGLVGEPVYLYTAPAPLLLGLVGVAVWVLWRREGGDGRRMALTFALALVLGIFAVARTVGPAFDYRLRWTWVLGMVGFVVVAWAGWLAVSGRWRQAGSEWLLGAAVAGLLVLSGLNMVSAARAGSPEDPDTSILAGLTAPTLKAVGRGHGDVLVTDSLAGSWYARGLVLQLERHGIAARVPPERGVLFGAHRVHRRGPVRVRLRVAVDSEVTAIADEPGFRLVATSVPIRTLRSESARQSAVTRQLDAERRAGRLDNRAYLRAASRLHVGPPSRHGLAGLYAIAVFIDERRSG